MGFIDSIKSGSVLGQLDFTINRIEDIIRKLDNVEDIPKLAELKSLTYKFYDLVFNSGVSIQTILRSEIKVKDAPNGKITVEKFLNFIDDFAMGLKKDYDVEISPIFGNDIFKKPRTLDDSKVRDAIFEDSQLETGIEIYVKRIWTETTGHSTIEFIYKDFKIVAPIMNAFLKVRSYVKYDNVDSKGTIRFSNPNWGPLIVSSLEI